jgi:CBS domain-containing protein
LIDPETGNFFTFLDILDIVNFALNVAHVESDIAESLIFQSTVCSQIANNSRPTNNPYYGVMETDNLSITINTMVGLDNIPRLPVINSQGNFEGIITQSKVVQFLSEHIHKYPVRDKTLADLLFSYKPVYSLPSSTILKDAFMKMVEERISGVAVIGINGELVGNISASDIKVIGYDALLMEKLNRPISAVMGLAQNKLKPVTVHTNTTIQQIFQIFNEEKLHRIYVSDSPTELVGVLNLVDLLKIVLEYC